MMNVICLQSSDDEDGWSKKDSQRLREVYSSLNPLFRGFWNRVAKCIQSILLVIMCYSNVYVLFGGWNRFMVFEFYFLSFSGDTQWLADQQATVKHITNHISIF